MAHGVFPTDYIVPTPDLAPTVVGVTDAVKAAGYSLGPIYITGAAHPEAEHLLLKYGWTRVQQHAESILRAG